MEVVKNQKRKINIDTTSNNEEILNLYDYNILEDLKEDNESDVEKRNCKKMKPIENTQSVVRSKVNDDSNIKVSEYGSDNEHAKENYEYSEDDSADDDEDYDDHINVIIKDYNIQKHQRNDNESVPDKKDNESGDLSVILNEFETQSKISVEQSLSLDLEIDSLIKESCNLNRSEKLICVQLNNPSYFCANNDKPSILLIPTTKSISIGLRDLLWLSSIPYSLSTFTNQKILNEFLYDIYLDTMKKCYTTYGSLPLYHNKTIGVLGAHYNNKIKNIKCFNDFTVLITRNGQIMDYAIHNKCSNINELFKKYDIKVLCVNSNGHDPLYDVLTYHHGLFYGCNIKIHPISIRYTSRLTLISRLYQFCPNNNIYSSFFRALEYNIKLIDNNYTLNIHKYVTNSNYEMQSNIQHRKPKNFKSILRENVQKRRNLCKDIRH